MTQPSAAPKQAPRLVVDSAKAQAPIQVQLPVQIQGAPKPASPKPQADAISTFIGLEIEARQMADLESLRFAITNSTRKIASFDEAFLVEPSAGNWRVTCAAGIHKIDNNAPLIQFMHAWLSKAAALPQRNFNETKFFDLKADAAEFGLRADDVPFAYALWLPIKSRTGRLEAALVAIKGEPWRPQTVSLLIPLAGAYGHAWDALQPNSVTAVHHVVRHVSKAKVALAALAMCAIAAFIPVPMSALAPAEVVARNPAIVAAPIDGVIADILQPAGALVEKDAPLISFADVNLRNTFELAKRSKGVAQAKYFKAVQNATASQKEIEEVAVAKAELDVAAGELSYAEEMLSRTQVKAERAGLVIYSSKSDWVGRPVKTGERIMEIGNPSETELRMEVPVSDAITMQEGGDVALFLDGDPLNAVRAKITRANYRPSPNAENQLVYRVHADFADGAARRIGLRGVARVSSHNVSLAFYLFRRPIAALRQRFGI